MIKFLLLYVRLSEVALVFISLVACYYIYRCVSNLVSSANDKNIKAVSDDDSLLPKMSENFDEGKPMINIEENEIEAPGIYKPETEVARKIQAVNVGDALEGVVKPKKERPNTSIEAFRQADECFETVNQRFSDSESNQKDLKKETGILKEDSFSNQPIVNNIDLPKCLLVNDLYARLTDLENLLQYF